MNYINNYFNSRDLFFNKLSLCDSEKAKTILKKFTREGGAAPIAQALLNFGSALFCYNSSTRFNTQRAVAIENSINGLFKKINYRHTGLESKEVDGLIYTIFWLSGYQQRGEAWAIARDLLDNLPSSIPTTLSDFRKPLHVFYDLTYLGLYLSPQGHSFTTLLKISKVAYFAFKGYSECSLSWGEIRTTIQKPTLANLIDLLARGIHLYGSGLQLYTTGKAFFK
ncbi:MAG: hypothetical protein KBA81_02630 [Rhabdochlamydiaceae bacterium]|nr:hypothetical protein [Rhabdochlamydiaceae bacterium]